MSPGHASASVSWSPTSAKAACPRRSFSPILLSDPSPSYTARSLLYWSIPRKSTPIWPARTRCSRNLRHPTLCQLRCWNLSSAHGKLNLSNRREDRLPGRRELTARDLAGCAQARAEHRLSGAYGCNPRRHVRRGCPPTGGGLPARSRLARCSHELPCLCGRSPADRRPWTREARPWPCRWLPTRWAGTKTKPAPIRAITRAERRREPRFRR